MKLKHTILLLVLALGLFAFIRLFESRQLSTTEAKERAARVLDFDRDAISSILIKNTEGKIELRRDDKGVWRVEDPVKDRADSMAVSQLFTTAEALRHDAVIGDEKKGVEKDQLKDYGLMNSETKLKLTGKEKPIELLFGKDAAVEGRVYVKVEGNPAVYVIGKDLKEQIAKKVDDFRDRKLTDVNTTQVTKVVIKTAAGEIEMEKKDQHWALVKPLKARGDDAKIGDLVAQAATTRIESFVRDAAAASGSGLQEPRATVSLWSEGESKPTVLELGASPKDDNEKIFAKSSNRDGVLLLPKTVEALADSKPNDLRDRNLVRVEADIVDRITIEGAGREKVVLGRKGESWVRKVKGKDEAINVAAARRLLDIIRTQSVREFVSDVATELPKYGLDHPKVKLTLSSYASENTAETKAGEKPIASVDFGAVQNDAVYARVEDEPFVVSVPETVLDVLLPDPLQWQPLEIYRMKPEEITSITVTKAGLPPVAIERDKDRNWKLSKGDGAVNQINANSLVNSLASLRAVHWVGAVTADHGFDKPSLVVTFQGGAGGKLSVGADTSTDFARATAEGLNGTFEMSKPDLSAFQLPLLEKPAAPAQPAPADPPAAATPLPSPPVASPPASSEAPTQPVPPLL